MRSQKNRGNLPLLFVASETLYRRSYSESTEHIIYRHLQFWDVNTKVHWTPAKPRLSSFLFFFFFFLALGLETAALEMVDLETVAITEPAYSEQPHVWNLQFGPIDSRL